jgi:hypothetical protein
MINSKSLTLSLPKEKTRGIERKCQDVLNRKNHVEIRLVASLVGTFVASMTGTRWGKLNYRALEREKIRALAMNGNDFDKFMSISEGLSDIEWWLSEEKLLPHYFGPLSTRLELFSDASLAGWGGNCTFGQTGGRWSTEEKTNHINWLELKAGFLVLQAFTKETENLSIRLNLDNTCAVAYIKNFGGRYFKLNALTKEIWNWCKTKNIWLSAVHLPGSKNLVADRKSRVFNDKTEWTLNAVVFDSIIQKWGNPSIDLFASRLNHKVEAYCSFEPDPHAMGVDAMSLNWARFELCYAFPPFSLLTKVLSKIKRDKAEIILVVPDWKAQLWYPKLGKLAESSNATPLTLPVKANTVYLPFNEMAVHPIWRNLRLLAFRLSGK